MVKANQEKKEKVENKEKEKTNQIVIDANHATLGRLASFTAKQLLSGTRVVIVNSEKAIVLGNKKNILQRYRRKRSLGRGTMKGPYSPKNPEAILKRTIRGMLHHKSARGRNAFKNLTCYVSVPKSYAETKKIVSKRHQAIKYITLEEISKLI